MGSMRHDEDVTAAREYREISRLLEVMSNELENKHRMFEKLAAEVRGHLQTIAKQIDGHHGRIGDLESRVRRVERRVTTLERSHRVKGRRSG